MKKIFFSLLLITEAAFAQSPYLGFDSHWEERSTFQDMSGGYYHIQNYIYEFRNDTIINSKTYYQLFRAGTDSVYSTFDQTWNVYLLDELTGFIREDTLTTIIYYVAKGINFEHLLYDFRLSVGDTIPYSYGFSNCGGGNVISLDTFYFDGQPRKRLAFMNMTNAGPLRIFEGIAASCGLLGFMCLSWDGVTTCLKGFYNATDTIRIVNCFSPVSVNEINSEKNNPVEVFPNPFTENFTVQIKEQFNLASYSIFSLSGTTIIANRPFDKSSPDINLKSTGPGIYFLKIVLDNEIFFEKLVSY
jgi:hypothetical protein